MSTRPSARTALALILAAACWGLGTVISKRAVEEFAPITLLAVQLTASVAVLAVALRWSASQPSSDAPSAPLLGRLGLLNPGLAYALGLLGLVHISASLSVMLWALEPLLILFLAGFVLHERIGASLVILSLVSVAGMLLVIYEPGGGSALGVVLTVAGVACCAVYTVVARRWLSAAASTARVVASQQVYALAFALILSAGVVVLGGGVRLDGISAAGWASAIGSGVLYYALAYWLYLSGLRAAPASVAAFSFYLIPVFGVAGAVLLLGERLEPSQWLGILIVLGALFVILRRLSPTAPQLV